MSRIELYIWTPEYCKPPIPPSKSSKSSGRYDHPRESISSDRSMLNQYKESDLRLIVRSNL